MTSGGVINSARFGMEGQFFFSTIYIIESLPPGEMRTGWNLYEELDPICVGSSPPVDCRYRNVTTLAEFTALLIAIRDEATQTGRTPILQIEVHGALEGIELASGETMPWTEIKPYLEQINQATRLNLFVLLSACEGWGLVQVIQPSDRAALLLMIGPKRDVYPHELQRASIAFYRTLFSKRDAVAAWRAMNASIDPSVSTFSAFPAAFMFKYVWHGYHNTQMTEEALARREAEIETQARFNGVSPSAIVAGRPLVRSSLRDEREHFERFKTHFFFCDLFPENATRFPATLEECLRFPED